MTVAVSKKAGRGNVLASCPSTGRAVSGNLGSEKAKSSFSTFLCIFLESRKETLTPVFEALG